MAKILDPTTPETLLWRDAVDLVTELTKHPSTAEALLIAFSPGTIRNRYAVLEGRRSINHLMSPPRPTRDPMPDEMHFWHPNQAIAERLEINREESVAHWSRGFSKYATKFKVYPVWLYRDDIIKMLRLVELLPPEPAPEPAPKSEISVFPTPAPESEPASELTSPGISEPVEPVVGPVIAEPAKGIRAMAELKLRRPFTPLQERIIALLEVLFPDGLPPKHEVINADLIHAVMNNWGDKRVDNRHKLRLPSYDTVERVVRVLRS